MKIAMVCPYPNGKAMRGGVEAVAYQLIHSLLGMGHQVNVIAIDSPTDCTESAEQGLMVHRIARGSLPGFVQSTVVAPRKIREIICEIQPDVLHVQGAAIWGADMGVPSVLTVHGIAEREISLRHPVAGPLVSPLLRSIERRAIKKLSGAIIINPYVFELRPELEGIRHWHIPNPISDDFYQSVPAVSWSSHSTNRVHRVLWVGNGSERKNLLLLLQIASHLKSVSFDVVGVRLDGATDYLRRCEVLAKELGVENIEFHGRQNQQGIIELMDRSSALLMTSVQETAPCVIAESFARGLAVVAPDAFGIPGMMLGDECGYRFDVGATAQQIAEELERRISRFQIGEAARRLVGSAYRCTEVARATVKVYESVCA